MLELNEVRSLPYPSRLHSLPLGSCAIDALVSALCSAQVSPERSLNHHQSLSPSIMCPHNEPAVYYSHQRRTPS
jgi:hypothetical protein